MKELLNGILCVSAALCVGSLLAVGTFALIEVVLPLDQGLASDSSGLQHSVG